jgi:phage-related protein
MATFTYKPDYSARKRMKPRVTVLKFGDGYEQRTTDGLNTKLESWSVSFKRSPTAINSIDSFLNTCGGVTAFNWETPDGVTKTFVCREWEISTDSPGWETLNATFDEVPEIVSA